MAYDADAEVELTEPEDLGAATGTAPFTCAAGRGRGSGAAVPVVGRGAALGAPSTPSFFPASAATDTDGRAAGFGAIPLVARAGDVRGAGVG